MTLRQAKLSAKDRERQEQIETVKRLASTEEGATMLVHAEQEVAERRARIKASPVEFIYRYVQILHPDLGLIPFRLWPAQAKVLKEFETRRLTIVLKARQLGLSWLALAYAVWWATTRSGSTIVILSREEEAVKELFFRVKVIFDYLPKWVTRPLREAEPGWPGPLYDPGVMRCEVRHPDGLVSRLIGEQSSPDSGRSFSASLVILDEWAIQEYAYDIWASAFPTINRKTGGKVIGISTARAGTLFQDVWEEAVAGKNRFHPIFLPWQADPSRDEAWYEETRAALIQAGKGDLLGAEYPATPEEAFAVGAAKSFPEFRYRLHTIEPFSLPEDWTRIRGYDHGFVEPCCVLWAAIDYDDNMYIYREFYRRQLSIKEIAMMIHQLETEPVDPTKARDDKGQAVPDRIDSSIADYQIFDRGRQSGPSAGEEFLSLGVAWQKCDKDREAGWTQLHSRLALDQEGKPKLFIFRTCENLIRELTRARTTKNGSDNVDKQRCDDHALDTLRYVAMSRPRVPRRAKPEVMPWDRRRRTARGESWMSW